MKLISQEAIESGSSFNEAAVRFHIIDQIIRHLGYDEHENTYLNLEEKLSYPYIHIGRRSKKDLPLGFPDYRAGLTGARGSFIVEAKAGNVEITSREVEQAHSYAAHAQVGANYFMLCNGSELRIYETLSGSSAQPIVLIPVSELNDRIYEIENVLAPKRLARHCTVTYDKKLGLSAELGSTEIIRSGTYDISEFQYRLFMNEVDCTDALKAELPQLQIMDQELELIRTAFEHRVTGGHLTRGDDGRIIADIRFAGVTIHNAAAMQLMGINQVLFITADRFISHLRDQPTMFEGTNKIALSEGSMVPKLFGGASEIDTNVSGNMNVRAAMFVSGRSVHGQYWGTADYFFELLLPGALTMKLDFVGKLQLELD
jgi:Type I restriction enzyme R protein N terminus (HSDR_N)